MVFEDFFSGVVSAVEERHSFNEKVASFLLPIKQSASPNGVESLVLPVVSSPLNFSVGGVDSGFVSKKLSFLDIVLIKTAGVIFDYKDSVLFSSSYHPSPFSFPQPILLKSGLERDEETQSISHVRLEKEISCAIEVIKKYKPKYLFIDGSLVPQYQDKPRKDSGVSNDYFSVVKLFELLYSVAKNNSTILVGCVEDSRGSRFRQILQEEVIPSTSVKIDPKLLDCVFDASLLDYYLNCGERTFAFPYTNSSSHAILKDYSVEWADSIFVFYIKCSLFDKPLRVEFVLNKGSDLKRVASEVAGVVLALSSIHKEYSFPSVLIEADIRAGLSEQEINVVYERLVDKLGGKVKLRRNNRPFG